VVAEVGQGLGLLVPVDIVHILAAVRTDTAAAGHIQAEHWRMAEEGTAEYRP
jgi:hypothetical protein